MLASAEAAHADLLAALEALSFESSHFLSGEGNNGQFVANALENAFAAITRAKGVQS
jgi:acyl-CoA hydrolase